MKERRYDLDWLRVLAMLAVFVFHCTRTFDTEGWHLKNAQQSGALYVLMRGLLWPWLMEMFFLLAGAASWYALQTKTARAYLVDRAKRLLVPLYTVGLFILLPSQFYFDLLTNAHYPNTFWHSLLLYFRQLGLPRITSHPENLLPLPFGGHLWFLQYLFLISLLTLPLLLYLQSERGRHWIDRLADWSDRPGGIILPVAPLALGLVSLRWLFAGQRTWADLVYYALFFLAGYALVPGTYFMENVVEQGLESSSLWLLAASAQGMLVLGMHYNVDQQSLSPLYLAYQIVVSVLGWSSVICVLGLGARFLNRNHRLLATANEAVLPFYLFHQTIILAVGFVVIRSSLGILPKLLLVMVISFPLILGLYAVVSRFNPLRLLFGMKLREGPHYEVYVWEQVYGPLDETTEVSPRR